MARSRSIDEATQALWKKEIEDTKARQQDAWEARLAAEREIRRRDAAKRIQQNGRMMTR